MEHAGRLVFRVHGRDHRARRELDVFLEALGLHVLTWEECERFALEQRDLPSDLDIVRAGISKADIVVVLFTPDETSVLKDSDGVARFNGDEQPQDRTRSNVLLEAGIAIGEKPGRTIMVAMHGMDPHSISDLLGVSTYRLDDQEENRRRLALRVQSECQIPDKILDSLGVRPAVAPPPTTPPQRVPGNLVKNWNFADGSFGVKAWLPIRGVLRRPAPPFTGIGATIQGGVGICGDNALLCQLSPADVQRDPPPWSGVFQVVKLDQTEPRRVEVGVWSRAEEVKGKEDNDYGLFVDVIFPGERHTGAHALVPFPTGTHGWQERKRTIDERRPISYLRVHLYLRRRDHIGRAWFDCVWVREL